jgi:hypothetical protein
MTGAFCGPATLRARRVTLRARWVTLRARWVTLRARWVTLRARWVTLTPRSVFRCRASQFLADLDGAPKATRRNGIDESEVILRSKSCES